MAAKALAADVLQARFGLRPGVEDVVVQKDVHGSPSLAVRGALQDRLDAGMLPPISLAHSDGVAVAALSLVPGVRVGIDIERIAPRPNGFAETWLAEGEAGLAILDGEGRPASEEARLTAIWCLKEATTKALGLGFKLAPVEVVVEAVDPDGAARLRLSGEAASRLGALGGRALRARVRVDARFAVAESVVEVEGRPVTDDPKRLAALAALLREKGFLVEGEARRKGASRRPGIVGEA
jgi:phosphopantetheinyl transferase (holo-ACP synthase)